MVYLDENLSYRDERSAELCCEQAANEEIT